MPHIGFISLALLLGTAAGAQELYFPEGALSHRCWLLANNLSFLSTSAPAASYKSP